MNNLRILARNIADTGIITATPALLSTLPETILQRQTERGVAATTTGLASQDFHLTWATDQKANMVAFTRTNWTTAATFHPTVYSSGSPLPILYDSGIQPAFSTTGLDTDIDVYTDADFAGYRNSVHYFPAAYSNISTMREINFTNLDAANPAGFMSQTRLWIGKYFQTTYDPPFGGVDLQFMDNSTGERADDGTHVVNRDWKARKLTIQLEFIPDADLPTLLAISRYVGKHGEVFLDVFPNGATNAELARGLYHRGAYRLVDSPTFNPYQVGLHKNTFTFEET